MTSGNSQALIKGLAVIVGEIALGVNGPFLFGRFGFYVPIAIVTAVMIGAAAGYVVASVALWARHKERALTTAPAVRQGLHRRAA